VKKKVKWKREDDAERKQKPHVSQDLPSSVCVRAGSWLLSDWLVECRLVIGWIGWEGGGEGGGN
jgi:hypothetical protein